MSILRHIVRANVIANRSLFPCDARTRVCGCVICRSSLKDILMNYIRRFMNDMGSLY